MFFSIWIYNTFKVTMDYPISLYTIFKFSKYMYFLKEGNNFLAFLFLQYSK